MQALELIGLFITAASSAHTSRVMTRRRSISQDGQEDPTTTTDAASAELESRTCAHCVVHLLRLTTQETILWRRLCANGLLVCSLELCARCAEHERLCLPMLYAGVLGQLHPLLFQYAQSASEAVVILEPTLNIVARLAANMDATYHPHVSTLLQALPPLAIEPTPLGLRELTIRALDTLANGDEANQSALLSSDGAIKSLLISCQHLDVSQRLGEHAMSALTSLARREDAGAHSLLASEASTVLARMFVNNEARSLLSREMIGNALETMGHLIEHRTSRHAVVAVHNTIPFFVSTVLSARDEGVQKAAGWILVSLAVDPELGFHVIAEGGLVGLAVYASSEGGRQQEEAAWAFANLSSQKQNAEPLMSDVKVLETLIAILKRAKNDRSMSENNPKACLQAIWTIANLAVHDHLRRSLADRGSIEELNRQLQVWLDPSTNSEPTEDMNESRESVAALLRQALRALANLAAERTNRARVAAGNGLDLIVRAACQMDAQIKEVAARTLAHLTSESNISQRFVQGNSVSVLATELLCYASSTRVQEEALLIALNLSTRQSQALVCDSVLAPIVNQLSNARSTVKIRERAARVLCNLCAVSMPNKMAIMKNGAMRGLNQVMKAREGVNQGVLDAAGEVMRELSAVLTPTSRRALVQAVMMPPSSADKLEARASRRGAGCGPSSSHTSKGSSPLAVMSALRESL